MIVFVVVGGWNCEGYDLPLGVYSTRVLAEAAVKNCTDNYDGGLEITEYTIDAERT